MNNMHPARLLAPLGRPDQGLMALLGVSDRDAPSAPIMRSRALCNAMKKAKKLTTAQKYASLKRQTEKAGMSVREEKGELVVRRKSQKRKSKKNDYR